MWSGICYSTQKLTVTSSIRQHILPLAAFHLCSKIKPYLIISHTRMQIKRMLNKHQWPAKQGSAVPRFLQALCHMLPLLSQAVPYSSILYPSKSEVSQLNLLWQFFCSKEFYSFASHRMKSCCEAASLEPNGIWTSSSKVLRARQIHAFPKGAECKFMGK